MDRTLVVLAAGLGRRFGGAKQHAPVGPGGAAILEYTAYDALQAGIERVVLVLRPGAEEFVPPAMADRLTVETAVQEQANGTADAVLAAAPLLDGPFLVANADDLYGREAVLDLVRHAESTNEAALVGYPLGTVLSSEGPVSRAVCRTDDAYLLTGLEEFPSVTDPTDPTLPVSMNLWAFGHEHLAALEAVRAALSHQPEFGLPQAVDRIVRGESGAIRVLPARSKWHGMTHAHDRERVESHLATAVAAGDYPPDLWA